MSRANGNSTSPMTIIPTPTHRGARQYFKKFILMKSRTIACIIIIPVVLFITTGGYLQIRNGQSMFTFNPSSSKADKARKQAEPIIIALEQYHLKHGEYPQSIQSLVSGELENIPEPPVYGYPCWIYYQGGESGGCSIGFGAKGAYPACHYSLNRKKWSVDN